MSEQLWEVRSSISPFCPSSSLKRNQHTSKSICPSTISPRLHLKRSGHRCIEVEIVVEFSYLSKDEKAIANTTVVTLHTARHFESTLKFYIQTIIEK
jgi:hypothetical protein